jgi:hypothetical protein
MSGFSVGDFISAIDTGTKALSSLTALEMKLANPALLYLVSDHCRRRGSKNYSKSCIKSFDGAQALASTEAASGGLGLEHSIDTSKYSTLY